MMLEAVESQATEAAEIGCGWWLGALAADKYCG